MRKVSRQSEQPIIGRRRFWEGIPILYLFFLPGFLSAQSTDCGCVDTINVNLDTQCQFTLQIENVQAGNCVDGAYVLVDDDREFNNNIVDCAGAFPYGIFVGDRLICSGVVFAEDKTGPIPIDTITTQDTIECYLFDQLINNPVTIDPEEKYYLGEVLFQDNCSGCGCYISRSFSDKVVFEDCPDVVRTGVYATMTRKWTAVDCNGDRTTANQIFTFVRPSLDTLTPVKDTTHQSCNPEDVVILTEYPFWKDVFGDTVYLNELDCNYATSIEKKRFEVCDDGSYKQEYYVRVFDWCSGSARYVDTFLVKVGDFKGAAFSGNAENVEGDILQQLEENVDRDSLERVRDAGKLPIISTGPMDCTAALSLEIEALRLRLGIGISDCSIPEINVRFYSYIPEETSFGFLTGDTVWVETNFSIFNDLATGLPVGVHAIVIETSDQCKSTSTGLAYFMVKDRVAPVMKCDDAISVVLTTANADAIDNQAYARLNAGDVNEGSWDNCDLDFLKIRRAVGDLASCQDFFINNGYDGNLDGKIDEEDWFDEDGDGVFDEEEEYKWEYVDGLWFTPWRDYAEFFCCDVDRSITIELGGWDRARDPLNGMLMRNTNTCWQTTIVEDNSVPNLTPLPPYYIDCTDDILPLLQEGPIEGSLLDSVRVKFGESVIFGIFCGDMVMTERLVDRRDRCGFGRIDRIIEVEKVTVNKGTKVGSLTQRIYVQEVFDYNICFPADIGYDCENEPDSIPGVSWESDACDLITVMVKDEQFNAVGETDACYKIFRTYSVINWCEYDGDASPVVVSRDWDGWNGCDIPYDPNDDDEEEYNINPRNPDGDDIPGDEGICVIVKRNFNDNERDVVYYDRNADPFDNIPDDEDTDQVEGYWWKVVSGSSNPNVEVYYEGGYLCSDQGVWDFDLNDDNDASDPSDDDDFRYGSAGFWQYTQHIKVTDGVAPSLELTCVDTVAITDQFACTATINVIVESSDNCTAGLNNQVFLDLDNDGEEILGISDDLVDTLLTTKLPAGTHRIIVRTSDICGNSIVAEKVISIVDSVGPRPVCLNGIIVNLLPNIEGGGIKDIWATDFIGSPIGDCTGQGPNDVPMGAGFNLPLVTDYSINRIGEEVIRDSTGLFVTCEDLGGLVPVEVHAWDESGNHGFCTTFIEVQDNGGYCSPADGGVAGIIATENYDLVQDVEVELSGARSMKYATDENGNYNFEGLAEGHDYTIIPTSNAGHANGISTFDLVMISRHILGVKSLDSPYKIIAADVNRSGSISTLDLIQIRKIILQIDDEFPSNSSWRFIDADFVFPDDMDPWKTYFPEIKNINNLEGIPDVNFIAVKVGDVNYSATYNELHQPEVRTTEGALVLNVEDQLLQKGEEYTMYLNADLSEIGAYQFALGLDTELLSLVGWQAGLHQQEDVGVFETEGKISAVYYHQNGNLGVERLFGLRLRAQASGLLSDLLKLDNHFVESEAYGRGDESFEVVLNFIENDELSQSALFQNYPNPFHYDTQIGFYLDRSGSAILQIQDASGRVIKRVQQYYEKGYHQLSVNRNEIRNGGIYYYQLNTDWGFSTSKKMIIQ